ncbi:hypothetical protein [Scytonema sp. HK-05]|uniref:hypothetical protein n=1 Tax=Scytonema sp. HK-05 TaxID=1137095 RepID=UPI000AC29778|nr:hypothetical protein [Scytonema sp. HK-05]
MAMARAIAQRAAPPEHSFLSSRDATRQESLFAGFTALGFFTLDKNRILLQLL